MQNCRGVRKERLDCTFDRPLSGHPWGTGKWPLNGRWLLNKGLIVIIKSASYLAETSPFLKQMRGKKLFQSEIGCHFLSQTVFSFIIFLK